jgi:hypothetical protein
MPVLVESSTGISPVESSRDEHQPQIRNSTQNRNRKFLTPDRKFGPKAGIRAKSENSAPKPQIDQKNEGSAQNRNFLPKIENPAQNRNFRAKSRANRSIFN